MTTRMTVAQPRMSHSRPFADGLISRTTTITTAMIRPSTAQRARHTRMNQCWCAFRTIRSPLASRLST